MIQFMNHYTTVLNTLMSDDNVAADTMEKVYLVPAFVYPKDDNHYDRLFPTMSTPEGKAMFPPFQIFKALRNGTTKTILEAFSGKLKE